VRQRPLVARPSPPADLAWLDPERSRDLDLETRDHWIDSTRIGMHHHHHLCARSEARTRALALALIAAAVVGAPLRAQNDPPPVTREDREAVRRAVLDYVEGFYEGDSSSSRGACARWMISSVLWQSRPLRPKASSPPND
jgi:hypothetical protein